MNEAGALYFPIRLRCAAVSDLLGSAALEEAIARALGRCFDRARRALPASVTVGGGVALQPPNLTGGDLSAADSARLLGHVRHAINAAARHQCGTADRPGRLANVANGSLRTVRSGAFRRRERNLHSAVL